MLAAQHAQPTTEAPNACWQLDATEYVVTGGRRCVVFQLIDDRSRYAVAPHVRKVNPAGVIHVDKVFYKLHVDHAFKEVLVTTDRSRLSDAMIVTDLDGEILAELTRPQPGITYVGNGQPRGGRPKNQAPSPKS